MKRFSPIYFGKPLVYVSATVFALLCTTMMYPSVIPQSCRNRFPANCADFRNCLRPVFEQQTEEIIEACVVGLCNQAIGINSSTVITVSGVYCLTEDLVNLLDTTAITVAAGVSNVVIDLNGHTISGDFNGGALIDVLGNNTKVTIMNGRVNPEGNDTTGIRVEDSFQVVLSDLTLLGITSQSTVNPNPPSTGISLVEVTDFRISRCSFTSLGTAPLEIISCRNGKVSWLNFADISTLANTNIFAIQSCLNILVDNVVLDHNLSPFPHTEVNTRGFLIQGSSSITLDQCTSSNAIGRQDAFTFINSSDCICRNCSATDNVRTEDNQVIDPGPIFGFRANNCERIIFDSCETNSNFTLATVRSVGFLLENTSSDCCIINCQARSDLSLTVSESIGFLVDASGGTNINYLFNNVSVGNGRGFKTFEPGESVILGNYAEMNGGQTRDDNYENVPTDVVITFSYSNGGFSSTPSTWFNISVEPGV